MSGGQRIGRAVFTRRQRIPGGLVAAVSTFLAEAGANIISLDQHSTEQTGGMFMQRTVFHLSGLAAARDDLARDFAEQVAEKFAMDFRLTEAAKPKRVAIMASKEDHCLLDLLWRNRRGALHRGGRRLRSGFAASQGITRRPPGSAQVRLSRTGIRPPAARPRRDRQSWRHRLRGPRVGHLPRGPVRVVGAPARKAPLLIVERGQHLV
jgi:predicted amino acid-binding ACT domain protein